ncbi:mucin-17-like [Mytilus californianus]|uniref:mucin-17-like n=1 Tax=Mytilus californianus TaxID=6549 RepID=UPI0022478023|nr:mucin-17-like [Mytilus californianus]
MSKPCVVVFGYVLLLFQGILTIQLKFYTACNGNTGLENSLQPSCAIGEKIAVVGVYAFAKELSTSCPTEITLFNAAVTPDTCCQYDSNDCYILYVGSTYRSYYQLCNGNALCNIQVASVTTTCNQYVYLARTNYMTLYYYCISDQGLDPCTSLNTKDNVVFLLNSGYPLPLSGLSTCTCSLEASCASRIRVRAIDLRLGTSTACDQSITITDDSTVMVFDCSDNNDYLPTTLYISTSHFIQIQIVDNLWMIDGYYFILLEGISSGAELTLSCGSKARNTPTVPFTSLPDCHSTDVTTERITTPIVTTDITTTPIVTIDRTTTPIVTTDSTTTPIVTTTETYASSEAAITSFQSTYVESMTTSIIAGADTTTDATTAESTNERTTLYKQETYTSADQNLPLSGLTSTEKKMIDNGTLTTISSASESLQETPSIVPMQTTEKNVTVTEEQSSPTSIGSLIIGVTAAIILKCALVILLMVYRYKIKKKCGKKKVSSIIDEEDIENIPCQIAPLNHCFTERHQRTLDGNEHLKI